MAQLVKVLNDDCDVFKPPDLGVLTESDIFNLPPRVASRTLRFTGFK